MAKEFNLREVLAKVEDVVKELKENDEVQDKFKKNPIKTLEELTGLDLPDEKVEKVIDLVKAKVEDADIESKLAALEDKAEAFGDKLENFFDKLDK